MIPLRVRRLERATAETLQEARRDIRVEVLNSVIPPICTLFLEVNADPDPQERMDRFALGFDKIVDDYLASREETGQGNDKQEPSLGKTRTCR